VQENIRRDKVRLVFPRPPVKVGHVVDDNHAVPRKKRRVVDQKSPFFQRIDEFLRQLFELFGVVPPGAQPPQGGDEGAVRPGVVGSVGFQRYQVFFVRPRESLAHPAGAVQRAEG
jgi:hypothetical protein